MEISFKKLLSPNTRALVTPAVMLAVLIILSLVVVRVGLSRATSQADELEKVRQVQGVLQQKENLLRSVEVEVNSFIDASTAAVPEKNASLMMVSQLKNLAAIQGVTVGNFKVGSESGGSSDLTSVEISFAIDGTFAQIVNFLRLTETLAPLSTLGSIDINQTLTQSRAEAALFVYYSPFPQRLPSLNEPAKDLTDQERELLTRLSGLSLPLFIQLPPQAPAEREEPF